MHMYSSRHQLLFCKKIMKVKSNQTSLSNKFIFCSRKKKFPAFDFAWLVIISTGKICNLAYYYFIPTSSCLFFMQKGRPRQMRGVTVELHMNLFVKISYHLLQLLRCFLWWSLFACCNTLLPVAFLHKKMQ